MNDNPAIAERIGTEESLWSERFRIEPGAYLTRLFLLYGTVPAVVLAILTAVALILAVAVDVRFVAVALMVVCLGGPMIPAWLYFSHGFLPTVSFNVTWHRIGVSGAGLTVVRMRPVYAEVEEEEAETGEKTEGGEEKEKKKERIVGWEETGRDLFIPGENLQAPMADGAGVIIPMIDGFVALPRTVWPDEESFSRALEIIGTYAAKRQ